MGGSLDKREDGWYRASLGGAGCRGSVALVDGGLMAIRASDARNHAALLDENLTAIPSLMMEDWSYAFSLKNGGGCVVDLSAGIVVQSRREFDMQLAAPILVYTNEKYGFPIFNDSLGYDAGYASACVGESVDVRACLAYLRHVAR